MFQAELGRMMREEQQKDYLREAERARLTSKRRSHRKGTRGFVVLPLVVLTLVARLIEFSGHAIRH